MQLGKPSSHPSFSPFLHQRRANAAAQFTQDPRVDFHLSLCVCPPPRLFHLHLPLISVVFLPSSFNRSRFPGKKRRKKSLQAEKCLIGNGIACWQELHEGREWISLNHRTTLSERQTSTEEGGPAYLVVLVLFYAAGYFSFFFKSTF